MGRGSAAPPAARMQVKALRWARPSHLGSVAASPLRTHHLNPSAGYSRGRSRAEASSNQGTSMVVAVAGAAAAATATQWSLSPQPLLPPAPSCSELHLGQSSKGEAGTGQRQPIAWVPSPQHSPVPVLLASPSHTRGSALPPLLPPLQWYSRGQRHDGAGQRCDGADGGHGPSSPSHPFFIC